MTHPRPPAVDFPTDVAAAISQYSAWKWSDSRDGRTAWLAKDGENGARAEALDADGSLILAANWTVSDATARIDSLEGRLACACQSGAGYDERTVMTVLSAASMGCFKFSGKPASANGPINEKPSAGPPR